MLFPPTAGNKLTRSMSCAARTRCAGSCGGEQCCDIRIWRRAILSCLRASAKRARLRAVASGRNAQRTTRMAGMGKTRTSASQPCAPTAGRLKMITAKIANRASQSSVRNSKSVSDTGLAPACRKAMAARRRRGEDHGVPHCRGAGLEASPRQRAWRVR